MRCEFHLEANLGNCELEGSHTGGVDVQALCGRCPDRYLGTAFRGSASDAEFLKQPREVGFVECAGDADKVAEVLGGAVAEACEAPRRRCIFPAAGAKQPQR